MQNDISREGVTKDKLLQPLRLFIPRHNRTLARVSKFSLINIARINELLGTDFKGVILDIDECVAPHHGEVLPENVEAIIKMIQNDVACVIFSNMKASERYRPLIEAVQEQAGYELRIITSNFAKPDPRGFQECLDALGHPKENVLMIGDNHVTDGGSVRAGISFAKVKPIKTREGFVKKAKRLPQISSRGFFSSVSRLYDFIGRRRVLTDKDFT
jgi:predicted HAD superfamily phosphohydrolase YqeG